MYVFVSKNQSNYFVVVCLLPGSNFQEDLKHRLCKLQTRFSKTDIELVNINYYE